ncbi:MAG: apolipoprotein N-acyltransferase [Phycisphaerales bacterium]
MNEPADTTDRPTLKVRRPFMYALLLGLAHSVTFALAFPPFNLWPLVFVTLVPLMMVAGVKRAPLAVWLACLPAFAFHHWWLKDVTLVGTPLLVMYMSVWPAVYVWLLRWICVRAGLIAFALAAVMLWPAIEFFRGDLFMQGYPWFELGQPFIQFNSAFHSHEIAQFGSIYAVGLIIACISVMLLVVADLSNRFKMRYRIVAALIVLMLYQALVRPTRLYEPPDHWFRVAIIQTNIPQSNKQFGSVAERVADFEHALDLTFDASQLDPPPDLIVWPETMVPADLGLNAAAHDAQARIGLSVPIMTPEGEQRLPTTYFGDRIIGLQRVIGVPMLVGAIAQDGLRYEDEDGDGTPEVLSDGRYNSAFLIRDGVVEETRYDKITLTPFGEVMPYISAWPWLERQLLALGAQGMSFDLDSGARRTVFEVANPAGEVFRIVTPICFEITYAGACRELVFEDGERRADLMLNLTNDGWFGEWDPGRELHLDAARWRAAELATPVVRAANTGYSCLIDESGRVVSRLEANEEGVLVVEVAKGQGTTRFARTGFLVPWLATGGSVALLVFTAFRGGRGRKASQNTQARDGSDADDT